MPQSSLNRTAAAIAAAAAFLAGSSASSLAASDSAIFAGGCFWCVESDFDSVDGVLSTVSGYIGGNLPNPTYKDVTRGNSGHYEAVKIEFDPEVVEFRELADKFFRSVDPTDDGGQFCDRGDSYRTAIFANDDSQRMIALAARDEAETALGMKIVTPILETARFYPAEDYHQDYYLGKNLVITRFGVIRQSEAYKRYREGCGRDARVRQLWGNQAAFTH